jgi:hypothetical protein
VAVAETVAVAVAVAETVAAAGSLRFLVDDRLAQHIS